MALGEIEFSATLNPTGKWVTLQLTCTGMTKATIYRVTPDGTQAVRGAFNKTVAGALAAADYEAPQNTTLTYFARISDGVSTQESQPLTVDGQVSRGGDVIFGLTNPLATLPVTVEKVNDLLSESAQEVVKVVGRKDPIVVSDVRQYQSGSLSVFTLTPTDRQALLSVLESGAVIAFSPQYPDYGFSDVWYLAVSRVTETRVSPIGSAPERRFTLEFQRVAAPPADFVGPAFRTWQDVVDDDTTWQQLYTSNTTWLLLEVV